MLRRPYIAEVAIKPGSVVIQGSADNKVKLPPVNGGEQFIGIYSFEANEIKNPNEPIGIVIEGVAKALAGANVIAGYKAGLKNDGSLINWGTTGSGMFVGIFLESGSVGEYVDVLIQHDSTSVDP